MKSTPEIETETGYVEAYKIESYGGYGNFKLKILLDIGRDFTETDKSNLMECAEKIQGLIRQETMRLDPKAKKQAEEDRKGVISLFDGQEIYVEEMPNGYSDSWYSKNLPWFKITTRLGRIIVGWRKRVINIDWSDSAITKTAKELFDSEAVTKGDKYIHADDYDKAKEYIKTLLESNKK